MCGGAPKASSGSGGKHFKEKRCAAGYQVDEIAGNAID